MPVTSALHEPPRRTWLLPGYALDAACYAPLDLPADRFRAVDFIPPRARESLPDYAARFADAIGFRAGDAVAGLSLGGMLALEIARHRGASRALLLASATHSRFLRPRYRAVAASARFLPQAALHALFSNLPSLLRRKGSYNADVELHVRAMLRRHPPEFLQRFPRMMLEWEGCEPAFPCFALHSEHDWLVAPPRQLSNLTLLPGRSHLLTIARPEAVRRFLLEHGGGA